MRQPYIIIPRNKKSIHQTIETIFSLKEFKDKIKDFRKKHEINKLLNATKNRLLKKDELIDSQKWRFDLDCIIQDLGLSNEWLPAVFDYATTGKIITQNDPEGIIIFEDIIDTPKYTKTDYIIKIHKNTTESDFKNAWKKIKNHFNIKDVKEKLSDNFDRDTFIYQLRKEQKLSYKEIRKILCENEYGKLDEPYIRSLVNKREKKIESLRTIYFKK